MSDPLTTPTDYADPANWIAAPAPTDRPAATLYLYPSTFWEPARSCAVTHPGMRAEAVKVVDAHAGVFEATDLHAPFYRQLGLDFIMAASGGDMMRAVAEIPLVDARLAFEHFLDHGAGDRPIVLAGHSQGAIVLAQLLGWLAADRPELLPRIVAAYLVGVPVTERMLGRLGLPFATGASDTGVVVSYNTESPDADASPFRVTPPGLAINPVSWRRDEAPAPASESLGSRIRLAAPDGTPTGEIVERPRFAGARVDLRRGTVVTDAPVSPGERWPAGVLHRYDYDLFWHDLRQNVTDRVAHAATR